MDSLELNKIVGAILVAALVITAVRLIGDGLIPHPPARSHITAGAEKPANPEQRAATETRIAVAETLGSLLANARPEAGEAVFKKCKSCHTVDKGGANRVGPNLWDIVGRPVATATGFGYSKVLQELGGTWTYEQLNQFLLKPKAFAPGTKMSFGGLSKADDRANLIAFLRSLSDAPKPLP